MMQIEQGLLKNMVLQRCSGSNGSHFSGACGLNGDVCLRIRRGNKVLPSWNGIIVGKAARGRFTGKLSKIPPGGPYDLELVIEDKSSGKRESCSVRNVLVGDVWILAGQSNMEGIGWLKHAAKPHSMVRAFYMNDMWKTAKDPIHNLCDALDRVHADLNGGTFPVRARHVGAGPGVAFGREMFAQTGVPQGLIACAHGGTSMSQWNPALKSKGSASLYGAMLRRFHKNGGRVAGMIWYQGCSDTNEKDSKLYMKRMLKFVKSARGDMGHIPLAAVQIAGVMTDDRNCGAWNRVQESQRLLPKFIKDCAVVPAIDLEMDDQIHISGRDQNRLGKRLARAMLALGSSGKQGKPQIELDSIRFVDRPPERGILVRFRNVTGRLKAEGKPAGFQLVEHGKALPFIYRIDLEKNTAMLNIICQVEAARKLHLHYGYGLHPYCNITDEADKSLPIFGPVSLDI